MLIRILAVVLLLAASPILAVKPAAACSCVMPDPRAMLENETYDAAFVGRAVSHVRSDTPGGGSLSRAVYTFEVEASVKGDLGEQVQVGDGTGGSCGLEAGFTGGERTGLFLRLDEQGNYRSGLCGFIDPDVLLDATAPLPPPDGSGPVRLLVGGSFGDARLIALDENGRTLAYGRSGGPTVAAAVCPGGERSVEVYGPSGEAMIGIRDLRTFEIVEERKLIDLATVSDGSGYESLPGLGGRSQRITSMACLDPTGVSSAFIAHTDDERTEAAVVTVHLDARNLISNVVWKGRALAGTFSPDGSVAYVVASPPGTEHVFTRIDLETARITEVAAIPGLTGEYVWSFEASPQGDAVVAMFYQERKPWHSRLVLVDATVTPARVVERSFDPATEGGRGTELLWTVDDLVLVIPNQEDAGLRLFDLSLNELYDTDGEMRMQDPVMIGDRVYGLDISGFGALSLVSTSIASGESTEHRKFAYPDVLVLVGVPGDTVSTAQPAAVTEANNIPANAEAISNSQPQAVDGGEELTSAAGDAGFGGRDIAIWSAVSFGGLAALLTGFAALRLFVLRKARHIRP